MSQACIKGVIDTCAGARLSVDKFHIIRLINNAADEVRRQEQKERPELQRSRYVWLQSQKNLKTARVCHVRLTFQEFFEEPPIVAEAFLKRWYSWATHSRLEPMKEAACTIKGYWSGML